MSIFVNYDGPKLDKEQKRVVRSRPMVVVRGRRKEAKCQVKSGTYDNLGPKPEACLADTLQSICLSTPLAYTPLTPTPTTHLTTPPSFPAGDQLRSCPLLLCDGEDLSLAARYVDPATRAELVAALRGAWGVFAGLFLGGLGGGCDRGGSPGSDADAGSGWSSDGSTAVGGGEGEVDGGVLDSVPVTVGGWDGLADGGWCLSVPNLDLVPVLSPNSVPARLLETCVLATRIMRNTLADRLDGLDDPRNGLDVLVMYENVRFVGLKAWTGLPNLIGFAASRDMHMRSYFIAEVVRCAFSYGCYQMEVFQAVLRNFLHLRNAIAGRKMAMDDYTTGRVLGLARS
ncbi:predicted protein [Chaetomium globosum CBS 148.51]|uniref:Uncharacterized protein n=1 Tax=Chaetomium globosum (strain ATCC 6205 / CBS 148.51 / DSM 1962 / NBRC 6347 / NRRL 1970) TaxID=306901 RepID=Q2H1T0_CHAGB|nr:uncharacterized protein CHGG_04266 [Chaetomium globosum CBS 148.51]EAQ87647.1 predicted protein [Chaetomium globosum CBS 148.51]